MRRWLVIAVALLAVSGCSTPSRNPVPEELVPIAEMPGFAGIRACCGVPNDAFTRSFAESLSTESTQDLPKDAPPSRS